MLLHMIIKTMPDTETAPEVHALLDLHLDPLIMFGQILVSNKVSLRTQNQEKVELLALVSRSRQL